MMTRFIIFSLAVHILAVGVLYYGQPQHDAMPPMGTLSVSLHTASEAASKNLLPPTPLTTPADDNKPAPGRHAMAQADSTRPAEAAQLAETEQLPTETPASQTAANENKADMPQDRSAEADMLDSLRSAVYRALHANFSYPRRARQRGWEGTVVITLRILADGRLSDIRVAGSSGIATLDRAAVASLSKVSVPRLVALMHGRELDMTIPVEYRLTDG